MSSWFDSPEIVSCKVKIGLFHFNTSVNNNNNKFSSHFKPESWLLTSSLVSSVAPGLQRCALGCVQVWTATCWLSSRRSPDTPPLNTWCWGRISTSRAGTDRAGSGQQRWWWRWWRMFFLSSLPPQGARWNPAETGSSGTRGRLCELNYVTNCDTHTRAKPLWRFAQIDAYTCLTEL